MAAVRTVPVVGDRRGPAVVVAATGPGGGGGGGGAQAGRRPLRLTRRGRVVVRAAAVLAAALLALLAILLTARSADAGSAMPSVPLRHRLVLPGETLWQIAGEIAPHADPRDTVAEIVELNSLPGSGVAAGQRLALPVP